MFRHSSMLLCLAVAALVALGLTMMASTSAWVHNLEEPYLFLRKQSEMALLGLICSLAAAYVPENFLRKIWPWLLGATCVLLVLCFVPSVGVDTFGSRRWIKVPGLGQVQPSEAAKLAIVLSLAGWYARWQPEVRTLWRGFLIPGLFIGIPISLILVETDAGTALSLALTTALIMFSVGSRLLFLVPSGLAAAAAAAAFLRGNENRWARIQAWLDLDNPALRLGINMQQYRALCALGNGGPSGVGLGNGVEKFGTLTLAHSDFILPAIGEELGLIATLGIVLCFVLITVAGVGIAAKAHNMFNRCFALGLTCILVLPAMNHIAVTTAVLPNDGLPLPFVSYGGTSLVSCMIAVGLLVGIHRRTQQQVSEEFAFTKDKCFAVRL